ncbi:MAG: O-antigen ligase family protein [bacterium]
MEYVFVTAWFGLGALTASLNLRYGAYLVLATLPLYGVNLNLFGLPTSALELTTLGALAMFFWSYRKKLPEVLSNLQAFQIPLGLLLLAALISIFTAPDWGKSFLIFRSYYLEPVLFFVYLATVFTSVKDYRKILTALCLPSLAIIAFAWLQRLGLQKIPAIYAADERVTSLYSYANAVGLFLAPLIAAYAISLIQHPKIQGKVALIKDLWFKVVAIAIIVLGTGAIVFSKTEAAWLALVAVALIYGFSQLRFRKLTLGITVAGLITLALLPNLAATTIDKVMLRDFSGAVRRTTWNETRNFLADHYLLGAGLSGYQVAMAPYHKQLDIEIFWYPHTLILNFWVELGLLGVIALLVLIVTIYSQAKTLPERWLVWAPLSVMLIHGLFDVPVFKGDLAIMTFAFLAFIPILKRENPSLPPLERGGVSHSSPLDKGD